MKVQKVFGSCFSVFGFSFLAMAGSGLDQCALAAESGLEQAAMVDRAPAIVRSQKKEILVSIQGVKDFKQYHRIRSKIEDELPEGSLVQVKQLARGKALLSLNTVVATNELSQVLVNLPLEPGYFLLKGIDENRIEVEVQ